MTKTTITIILLGIAIIYFVAGYFVGFYFGKDTPVACELPAKEASYQKQAELMEENNKELNKLLNECLTNK